MNKKLLLLFVVMAGVLLIRPRSESALSTEQARAYLRAGAVVVDVRTPEEYAAGHLPGSVNIPLDIVKSGISHQVANKSGVVLLHCRSGRRSGIAERELRSIGYTNAFNIGSYQQAEKVVSVESSH